MTESKVGRRPQDTDLAENEVEEEQKDEREKGPSLLECDPTTVLTEKSMASLEYAQRPNERNTVLNYYLIN